MAITPDTPITGRAFRHLMHALSRRAPQRLGQVVQAGTAMRALVASRPKR